MTPIQQKLSQPIKLPSLAKNITLLMKTLADETLDFQQIADVIKHYPSITARLIFLANSPWSAPVNPVSSIDQACSRLGTAMVKSISIALALSSAFDTRKCHSFDTIHFWTTSLVVSEGAGLLAAQLQKKNKKINLVQIAQTAGILHNLGLLWLADNFPEETDQAFKLVKEDPSLTVSQSLQQTIGTDYCKVNSWMGKQLQLTDILIKAMAFHHEKECHYDASAVTVFVGMAANMATTLFIHSDYEANPSVSGIDIDPSDIQAVYQQLQNHFEKNCELANTLFS